MSLLEKGASALKKLILLAVLAVAFLFGMAGVVYMSLQGSEVKVPEITGKVLGEGEDELGHLGLKIKKRADRASSEPVDTVIEQSPKAGETVKTGQVIYVVTSNGASGADQLPKGITKEDEEDDASKIEEMISEKPKKAKVNTTTNAKKRPDTKRDAISTDTDIADSGSLDSDAKSGDKADKDKKGGDAAKPGPDKPASPAGAPKTITPEKGAAAKPGGSEPAKKKD